MKSLNRRSFMQAVPALGATSLLAGGAAQAETPHKSSGKSRGFEVAAFSCDVTPPVGSPLLMCHPPVATSIDTPLLAKGVVLSDGVTRHVLCAFDYCELRTGAHDLFRRKIANALQVNELQVEVHCIHQHDAPFYDADADALMRLMPSPALSGDVQFMESASDRVASAAADACKRLAPCTHVGCGKAKVEKYASNRRVPMPDGSIGVRYSHCNDPVLIAAPEGLIDPWLRTITFFHGDRPLVRLHYYASHPQSYYGKGHMNADTPGLARERLEKEEGIPQIYFTGCAGNIGAGKYNDGSPSSRIQMAERLYQGMKGAIGGTQRERCSKISWKTTGVRFALRTEPDFSEAHFNTQIADVKQVYGERARAASALAWYGRLRLRPSVDLTCYRIGPATILHLPGEAFIEYQLYAQAVNLSDFVATAAYGELGTGYICTDKAFSEGGYEPTQAFVGPPSEELLKTAIREVLS